MKPLFDLDAAVTAAAGAARTLAFASSAAKDAALSAMADGLEAARPALHEANERDLAAGRESGLSAAMLDRLALTDARITAMAEGLRQIVALPDPVGRVVSQGLRPNGLEIGRVRTPIGVVGIIYESRPNVTADAAGLCLKSGNAVVLRGGSEAIHSNRAIAGILAQAVDAAGLPSAAITFVDEPDRSLVMQLLKMDDRIDVIIPRGGEGLIRFVVENATIPVIKHDKGLCHTYVDREVDLEMAVAVALNAKVQRPGTCNAMETLLVHVQVAEPFFRAFAPQARASGVTVHGCKRSCALLTPVMGEAVVPAAAKDWDTEWLDLNLNVRVVDSIEEALDHIASHGSNHSEAILTSDYEQARRFLREVDAAAVYVNASTRFTDGFEFGLGAEIGISTNKLHARGPMGLEDLTTTKYVILGGGQIRE
ncbi:MAG: glutamate-5-semialdehyde dehydrogenase [Nitrospirota bacterium]|jgi:glutamate-5-semialdehyde dehydrogenase